MNRLRWADAGLWLLFVFWTSVAMNPVRGIHFYLQPGMRRCFTEDLPVGKMIPAEVNVASGKGVMELDVWVTTLDGTVLYHKRSPSHGKFIFQTPVVQPRQYSGIDEDADDTMMGMEDDEETIRICVEHQQHPHEHAAGDGSRRLVSLAMDHTTPPGGVHRDAQLAQEGNAAQLQDGLSRVQDTLASLVSDITMLQQRERILVKHLHATNKRVATYAIISILVAALVSFVQLQYFKIYFKQKKIC
jgi:emp24/gp25L/p24 family/GOLD